MPSGKEIDAIDRLSQLIADHGVYAILVLVIFFVWYRVWSQVRNAKTADEKAYLRRVHTTVLVSTFVLVALASGVWIYSSFFYFRTNYIRGWVTGLSNQPVAPTGTASPALVVEQVIPGFHGIDFYSKTDKEASSLGSGSYVQEWLLSPHVKPATLRFTFQHEYAIFAPIASFSEPNTKVAAPRPDRDILERHFRLDLQEISYSPAMPFELVYERDAADPVKNVGKMFRLTPGKADKVPVPWEEDGAATKPHEAREYNERPPFSLYSTIIAYASNLSKKGVFQEDGQYDAQTGRALWQRLGSSDLQAQLEARRILVENGKRCFRFVENSLKAAPDPAYDRGLLVHNLASAVEEIEAGGRTPIPLKLQLELALAFYRVNDYRSAARFFRKAGDGPIDRDEYYFYRAFAYSHAGLEKNAIESYERYLRGGIPNSAKAVTRFNMGLVYERLGDENEAIQQYKKAITFNPQLGPPHNNLAYLYANHSAKLQEAFVEVNRALALQPDEPRIKDTKGWVLYKMGRYEEARRLLEEAASQLPNEREVQRHLEVARQATAQPRTKK
jgi:tetratricopeptide (TPR) repeat protein